MEIAHLSGFAAFAGSVVVALGSLASAWLTKKHEARARRASENKVGRQKLYAQFIEAHQCSMWTPSCVTKQRLSRWWASTL